MKEDLKDIKAGIGLGIIKFGMSREQVTAILGDPTETEVYSLTDSENDLTETWHFDELDLSMGFIEEEDWRLVTLSVSSGDFLFRKENLFGLDEESLVNVLENMDIDDLEIEDCSSEENPDHVLVCSPANEMNFWLDNGQLSEIQWGPLFIDDETIRWPE